MRTTHSPLPNVWRNSGSVIGCAVAVLFNMLVLKWCTSIVHSFSTKTSNLSDIAALSSAGKLTIVPWTKLPEKVQTGGRLGKYSTNFDVLRVLHETDGFAPFVGTSGVAVVTGGTGGIGIPVSDFDEILQFYFLFGRCIPNLFCRYGTPTVKRPLRKTRRSMRLAEQA